jgi:hypothetical protein
MTGQLKLGQYDDRNKTTANIKPSHRTSRKTR